MKFLTFLRFAVFLSLVHPLAANAAHITCSALDMTKTLYDFSTDISRPEKLEDGYLKMSPLEGDALSCHWSKVSGRKDATYSNYNRFDISNCQDGQLRQVFLPEELPEANREFQARVFEPQNKGPNGTVTLSCFLTK